MLPHSQLMLGSVNYASGQRNAFHCLPGDVAKEACRPSENVLGGGTARRTRTAIGRVGSPFDGERRGGDRSGADHRRRARRQDAR